MIFPLHLLGTGSSQQNEENLREERKARQGFSLVETILAVTVIGLVIAAAAQLTQRSLALGRITMNQFIAYHLAEEGVEVVRSVRDSNWLQNVAWQKGLTTGTYVILESRGSFSGGLGGPGSLGGKGPWRLEKLSPSDSKAAQIKLSDKEIFSRTIEISSGAGGGGSGGDKAKKIIRVKSMVQYDDRGEKRSVSLMTELTDWKKGPL